MGQFRFCFLQFFANTDTENGGPVRRRNWHFKKCRSISSCWKIDCRSRSLKKKVTIEKKTTWMAFWFSVRRSQEPLQCEVCVYVTLSRGCVRTRIYTVYRLVKDTEGFINTGLSVSKLCVHVPFWFENKFTSCTRSQSEESRAKTIIKANEKKIGKKNRNATTCLKRIGKDGFGQSFMSAFQVAVSNLLNVINKQNGERSTCDR